MFETFLNLEESATVAINSLAQEKKAKGERVYNLSAGEPMLSPHPAVAKAASIAIAEGKTLYPPVAGIPPLRQASAQWLNTTYQTNYQTANTLITCGGKFGIFAACQAFLKPDDEVLIPAPYWVSYPAIVKLFGGKPITVMGDETNNWKVSALELEKLATPKTKMLILNNAGNPTGSLYARTELAEIVSLAKARGWMIISDEVYSGLSYDGEFISLGSFPEITDNLILVQSFSKHFAMTGWRVGMIFAPEYAIKILTKIQGQSTTGTSSISQYAALSALENATEIQTQVCAEMRSRRDALVAELNTFSKEKISAPASGLYLFFPLKILGVENITSAEFCLKILRDANIALVPGGAFGCEGYARASFGAPVEELKDAVSALKKYLKM